MSRIEIHPRLTKDELSGDRKSKAPPIVTKQQLRKERMIRRTKFALIAVVLLSGMYYAFDRWIVQPGALERMYSDVHTREQMTVDQIIALGQKYMAEARKMKTEADRAEDDNREDLLTTQSEERYVDAAAVFQVVRERYADSPRMPEAALLSGESYLGADQPKEAVVAFTYAYTAADADVELRAQAMYRAGDCYMQMRQYSRARDTYRKLIGQFPQSGWATQARNVLKSTPQFGQHPTILRASPFSGGSKTRVYQTICYLHYTRNETIRAIDRDSAHQEIKLPTHPTRQPWRNS